MSKVKEYFEDILETLDCADSQLERLEILIEYAKEIPEISQEKKTNSNKVRGCTSEVYIDAYLDEKGNVCFSGSSEALIVKAYVAILLNALSGISPQEVLESKKHIEEFAQKSNLKASLTPSRANAFGNVVDLIMRKTEKLRSTK